MCGKCKWVSQVQNSEFSHFYFHFSWGHREKGVLNRNVILVNHDDDGFVFITQRNTQKYKDFVSCCWLNAKSSLNICQFTYRWRIQQLQLHCYGSIHQTVTPFFDRWVAKCTNANRRIKSRSDTHETGSNKWSHRGIGCIGHRRILQKLSVAFEDSWTNQRRRRNSRLGCIESAAWLHTEGLSRWNGTVAARRTFVSCIHHSDCRLNESDANVLYMTFQHGIEDSTEWHWFLLLQRKWNCRPCSVHKASQWQLDQSTYCRLNALSIQATHIVTHTRTTHTFNRCCLTVGEMSENNANWQFSCEHFCLLFSMRKLCKLSDMRLF